ncbi:DUF5672 family protein [Rubrivivax rivuli]|uniref:DUF5672 domain-containing protein n=1 Tax=Rubrivivax rivuli TaxID=1862385 RepID=A0A437RHF8_9BURK|nr:DUF5672 family protein [Rubrivivax rivuli]RVU46169.1 hypothetical protein EOE66_09925 [Rubrivivax rivuli]
MKRLALPQVTLCIVDTRAPALAAESLRHSMAGIDFGRVLLFTRGWQPPAPLPGIAVVEIAEITSGADYSRFVLRDLPPHIHTPFVLVTQWDGFVRQPEAWTDEFLEYDYIGAVWPDQPEGRNVGNGGFSLRSQKLLQAGRDARITELHPEDLVLGTTHRAMLEAEHGVRFAPPALAHRFAFENRPPRGPVFGFHGPYNLPRVLDENTLLGWLPQLPDAFFRSRDARRLARALLAHRMPRAATELLRRRRAAGRRDINTRALGWLAAAQTLVTPGARPR